MSTDSRGLPLRIALITPNFENNSLGRTWCLWLLAQHLGIEVAVYGVKGTSLWPPLAGSPFSKVCVLPTQLGDEVAITAGIMHSDLVIAIKPLPTSFGVARRIAGTARVPLIVDIDDPDIEVRTVWLPRVERWARRILKPRYRELLELGRRTRDYPRMVSNPALQAMYGGVVVPHVRIPGADPEYRDTSNPIVRFVGSPRGHKGVLQLRNAVARLAGRGFTLEITDTAPDDAQTFETWLGQTSLARGVALVADADIVAIPSLVNSWSPAQLPAKLIDAMMSGRAVVASRTPPIEWALGNAGILTEPGDVNGLTKALESLEAPQLRRELGERAHRRAVDLFSVEAVASTFEAVLVDAMAGAEINRSATVRGGNEDGVSQNNG